MNDKKVDAVTAIKLGGVIISTCIGTGFATGTEVLQFFNYYGVKGALGALGISCIIFLLFTVLLFDIGRELPENKRTAIFSVYFGDKMGTVLDWYCVLFVGFSYFIMLTGAGTTFQEFFGWNKFAGSMIMGAVCVITVILGLRRLTNIIGMLGTIMIAITIIIGLNAIAYNVSNIAAADKLLPELNLLNAGPNWVAAGICYACACMQILIPVLPPVGAIAENRRTAIAGAVFGVISYHLALGCLVFANFANLELIKGKQIPNLALSELLRGPVSKIFAVMIVLAIYSTACPMMWSFCAKILKDEKSKAYRIGVCLFTIAGMLVSYKFSLSVLINFAYSISGYICTVILIALIICRCWKKTKEENNYEV